MSLNTPIPGTNGGLLTVQADGSYTFNANGEFAGLAPGGSVTTSFDVTIRDAALTEITAPVVFTVRRPAIAPDITAVSISGTPTTGQTLTANVTEATGAPAPTLTYQWKRDTVPVGGATAQTHVTTVAGSYSVLATATNAGGQDSMESAAVAVSDPTSEPTLFSNPALTSDTPNPFNMTVESNIAGVGRGWRFFGGSTMTPLPPEGSYTPGLVVGANLGIIWSMQNVPNPGPATPVRRVAFLVKPGTSNKWGFSIRQGAIVVSAFGTFPSGFTLTAGAETTTNASYFVPGTFSIQALADGFFRIEVDYQPADDLTVTYGVSSQDASLNVKVYGGGYTVAA